jgi:hypothetical protein
LWRSWNGWKPVGRVIDVAQSPERRMRNLANGTAPIDELSVKKEQSAVFANGIQG